MRVELCCALALVAGAWASGATIDELQIQESIPVVSSPSLAPSGTLVTESQPQCDADGNVFLRIHGTKSTPSRLVRISADGKKEVIFDVNTIAKHERDVVVGVAVGLEGHSYVLAKGPKNGQALLDFDRDGRYKSAIEIDSSRLIVMSFGVFDSSTLLLAGYRLDDREEPPKPTPIIGVFKASGDLVAPLSDAQGVSREDREQKEPTAVHELGRILPGDAGLLYVWKPTLKGPVLAVSATGVVQSVTTLEPPKGAKLIGGLGVSKQRLAVNYIVPSEQEDQPARSWVQVYDLVSGERVAEYRAPARMTQLMCYGSSPASGDLFTMLGWSNGKMQFVRLSRK